MTRSWLGWWMCVVLWSAPAAAAEPSEDTRAQAKAAFERGVARMDSGDFEAGLSEFQASLGLAPTRSATENAAECLRRLGRIDEALEKLERFDSAFPDAPPEVKARVRSARDAMLAGSGTLEVKAEEGATVTVNGRPRGTLPLARPIRLPPGPHTVRISLEGYVPFVQTIDIRQGKPALVRAQLEVLARAGRLRVRERQGRSATVYVDGVGVGATPWEGALEPGDHAVWLATLGAEGSPPARTRVILGQRSEVVLELIELPSVLAVEVSPSDAEVYIDGAPVGRGRWEGRLPRAQIELNVVRQGFQASSQTVDLRGRARTIKRVELSASPVAPPPPAPPPPPHWEIEVEGALAIAPALLAPACNDPCETSLPLGAHALVRAGHRFSNGLGVGFGVGYLHLVQGEIGRPVAIAPAGLPEQAGAYEEDFALRGATLQAVASFRYGNPWFVHVGAAVGVFAGHARDERSFAANDSSGSAYRAGPYFAGGTVVGFTAWPNLSGGVRLGELVDLWVGVSGGVIAPVSKPRWAYGELVPAGADGAARLSEEELLPTAIGMVAPSLGVGIEL